jgi:hypothetical protein
MNVIHAQPSDHKYNTVESANIIIVNKTAKWHAWGTAQQLQKAFGQAKIKKEADEVLGGFGYTYQYKGFEVYFHAKRCEAIGITGSQYQVLLGGQTYTVGDHISKLKKPFPLSYQSRAEKLIHMNISYKGAFMDSFVAIWYDANGLIIRIAVANDNS